MSTCKSFFASLFLLVSASCKGGLATFADLSGVQRVSISGLGDVAARPGDEVNFTGSNLTDELTAQVDDDTVPLKLTSPSHGTFTIPKASTKSLWQITFSFRKQPVAKFPLINANFTDQAPTITADAAKICSDLIFKNPAGELIRGERNCEINQLVDCSAEGQTSCTATAAFPSVNLSLLQQNADKISSQLTIAGITGTFAAVPNCTTDNGTNCLANPSFPAVDKSQIMAGAFKSGMTVAGVSGTLVDCSTDNGTNCLTSAAFPSVIKASITAGVLKSGTTVAGIVGAYPNATYPLTTGDGFSDLTASNFAASVTSASSIGWFDRNGNRYSGPGDTHIKAGYITSGATIFGVTGTYTASNVGVTTLSAVRDTGQVAVSWTGAGTGFILVRRTGGSITWSPTLGSSYSTGAIDANHTILYVGSSTSFNDTAVVAHTSYDYKVFAFNSDHAYSSDQHEASLVYTNLEVCGSAGNLCYDNAAAIADGTARTPTFKDIEYVSAYGSFKVWKEVGGSRILSPDGSDNWAKALNPNGKGYSSADFSTYLSLVGRVCPPNVYIDDSNKFGTGHCLYYSSDGSQGLDQDGSDNNIAGLSYWNYPSEGKWYQGNIQTCSSKGMRMPTIFETTRTDSTSDAAAYPTMDGSPVFAETLGVPSSHGTWTATTGHDGQSYWIWNGTGVDGNYFGNGYNIRCVLP